MQFNKEQKISPAQADKREQDELSEDELQGIVGGHEAGHWVGVADNKGNRLVWVPYYHVNVTSQPDLSQSTKIIPMA